MSINIVNIFEYNDILLEIMNYLDFESITNLCFIYRNKTLKEIIYWKAIERNVLLQNNSFLIKQNDFMIEEQFSNVYEYIKFDNNIVIAGGYCYKQAYECDLGTSDIDVFIIKNTESPIITFKKLYKYLQSIGCEYNPDHIGGAVWYFKLPNFNRIINVTIMDYTSLIEVLMSFDTSSSRYGIYKGTSYTTYDANYTKTCGVAYMYKNLYKKSRIDKIHNLGLQLYRESAINYTDKIVAIDWSHTTKIKCIDRLYVPILVFGVNNTLDNISHNRNAKSKYIRSYYTEVINLTDEHKFYARDMINYVSITSSSKLNHYHDIVSIDNKCINLVPKNKSVTYNKKSVNRLSLMCYDKFGKYLNKLVECKFLMFLNIISIDNTLIKVENSLDDIDKYIKKYKQIIKRETNSLDLTIVNKFPIHVSQNHIFIDSFPLFFKGPLSISMYINLEYVSDTEVKYTLYFDKLSGRSDSYHIDNNNRIYHDTMLSGNIYSV
jgi:hypothetical protein